MIKVLFICHGNICRSPMAEFVLKNLIEEQGLQGKVQADSAATSREEIGNDIYPPAKECLRNHNVPFVKHSARQITKADLENYDFIIAMEGYNIRNLERLLGPSQKYSLLLDYTDLKGDIADPWYSGDFETAFSQILAGCEGFLSKLAFSTSA